MAEYLNLRNGVTVLEPEAGTGNLVYAVFDTFPADSITVVALERHIALHDVMRDREYPSRGKLITRCEDFLEYAATCRDTYDRIIMNPPFSQVRKHMAAAIKLLADDGVLVALVPTTWNHDDAEELEILGPDTFPTAKVHTKIIRIER